MGILNRIRRNKSTETGQQDNIVSSEMTHEGVDIENYDISDDVLNEGLAQYYQAAENILNDEENSPKIAAASMKLLEIQLKDSYIVKGKYQSIEAKNNVANFSQSVRNHSDRLFSKLSPPDNSEVNKIVSISKQLIDETYYIDNYEIANNVRESKIKLTELKNRNSLGISIVQIGLVVLFLVCGFYLLFISGEEGDDLIRTISIIGAIIMFAAIVGLFFWQNKILFWKSKRILRKFEDTIDFDRFNQLDQSYNGNYEQAASLKEQHQKIVDQFFYQTSLSKESIEKTVATQPVPVQDNEIPSAFTEVQQTTKTPNQVITNDYQKISSTDANKLQKDTKVQKDVIFDKAPARPLSMQKTSQVNDSGQKENEQVSKKVVISYCMMCGTKVPETALYCPNCGSRLEL